MPPDKALLVVRAWLFYFTLGAWALGLLMLVLGQLSWALASVAIAIIADLASRVWSRKFPTPMPYFMRWFLHIPRGPQSPERLQQILHPKSGERILEIGPGIGVHALPIAPRLLPNGVLDVLEVQQAMLDELAARAERAGVTNIVLTRGDAQELPYPPHSFDAAYLVGVLGEIPDSPTALRQLRRVLKPSGRLIVSEVLIDPDFIPLAGLMRRADDAGFVFDHSAGPVFAYSAMFRPVIA